MGAFSALCCLFCCPPIPSRIAAKLAFLPPKPASYTVRQNRMHLLMPDNNNYCIYKLPERVTLHTFRSKSRNTIAAFHFTPEVPADYTILYSHGNAVDLGQMLEFFRQLSAELQVNIFAYDYSGYGGATGQPSESNACKDIEAAYNYLKKTFSVAAEKIIVYGQSIGSGPSVYITTKQPAAALVLHAPLMSGIRVLVPTVTSTYCCDIFPNIDRMGKVSCPVLVIQGTEDEVIAVDHGIALYEAAPRPLEPLWAEGAGHNDLEMHPDYLPRLHLFMHELKEGRAS
eukprot:comp14991_c0_seq1/m.11599 comp14991_c0_seq1/g.11599  ORF comp14991_c0_seq1/g.11599 comp14991_c0_seq1/m.11599 type:complete len:285 (-) comp14991_c0_seq1:523-1377(-)